MDRLGLADRVGLRRSFFLSEFLIFPGPIPVPATIFLGLKKLSKIGGVILDLELVGVVGFCPTIGMTFGMTIGMTFGIIIRQANNSWEYWCKTIR